LAEVAKDLVKRPFIAIGFFALLLLVPLAWTSSKQAVARLTFPVWQRLHYLIYPVALLALLHFYLRVKADHTQPLVYAAVVLTGFAIRIYAWRLKARSRQLRQRADRRLLP
jgi:sulfoxide reductase heme-binding subunit YedZ